MQIFPVRGLTWMMSSKRRQNSLFSTPGRTASCLNCKKNNLINCFLHLWMNKKYNTMACNDHVFLLQRWQRQSKTYSILKCSWNDFKLAAKKYNETEPDLLVALNEIRSLSPELVKAECTWASARETRKVIAADPDLGDESFVVKIPNLNTSAWLAIHKKSIPLKLMCASFQTDLLNSNCFEP